MSIFARYYQTELAYYRGLLAEFARQYPEVGHLVLEGSDDAVERLLQGASLLTSRLRFRAEDDFPELIGPLYDQLWLQHLRSVPAATLLQLVPRPNALRQTHTVPRELLAANGSASRGDQSVTCSFQTTSSVVLHPIALIDAKLDRAHPADLQLRLRFELTGGANFASLDLRALRLHFIGDVVLRLTLLLWLGQQAHRVSMLNAAGATILTLPRSALRPVGLDADEPLCPGRPTPLDGYRLLQEYFSFIDKFLGIELSGLHRAPADAIDDGFTLVFHLGPATEAPPSIDATNFALGCTPAINISDPTTRELAVTPGQTQYLIEAPDGREIFEVSGVGGYDRQRSQWIDYQPFFGDADWRHDPARPCYQLLRRGDGIRGVQTHVVISDTVGRAMVPPTERLLIALRYTDGDLPVRLGVGAVDTPTAATPDFVAPRNLTPVVPPRPLTLGRDQHWQLLALFNVHPQDLASVNGLTQVLGRACGERTPLGQQPKILDVRTSVGSRLHRQAVVPMRTVHVDVDEEGFVCEGQLFLFGLVLRELFSRKLLGQMFNQLTLRALPGGIEYRFSPR